MSCIARVRPSLLLTFIVATALPSIHWSQQRGGQAEGDSPQVGYAVIETTSGAAPVASALFSFRSDKKLRWEAGVAAVEPISRGRLFVFLDESGARRTAVALANPSEEDFEATFVLRDEQGVEKARKNNVPFDAGHQEPKFVDEIFPSDDFPDLPEEGSLTFETDSPDHKLAAVTLRQTPSRHGDPTFSTLPVANLDQAPAALRTGASSQIVLPHVGAGSSDELGIGLSTQIILINPVSQPLSLQVEFYSSAGNKLTVQFGEEEASEFSVSLAPDGVLRRGLTRQEGLVTGYAVVTSDGAAPAATALFQFNDLDGGLMSEAGVGAVRSTTRARIFVDASEGTRTGVAVAAAKTTTDTDLTFKLLDRNGASIAQAKRPLLRERHLAVFADELFSLPQDFQGLMEIRASQGIFPITLKLTESQIDPQGQADQILTTLPLGDLDNHSLATKLVFPHLGFGQGLSTRLILINTLEMEPISGKLTFRNQSGDAFQPPSEEDASPIDYIIVAGGLGMLSGKADEPFFSQILISATDPAPLEIDLSITNGTGSQLQLQPSAMDSLGRTSGSASFAFESLDEAVAFVDEKGLITANSPGWSTLTISAGGTERSTFIKVSDVSQQSTPGLVDIRGMAEDGDQNLFLVSPTGHAIWLLDKAGLLSKYAGEGTADWRDDERLLALFDRPAFATLNIDNNFLFVSDSDNHVIRLVHPGQLDEEDSESKLGLVETLAGTPRTAGCRDGEVGQALFSNPQGIVWDDFGRLWVADSANNLIRRIDSDLARVRTIAGQADEDCVLERPEGFAGSEVAFNGPTGLALDSDGQSVIVADTGNGSIKRIAPTGEVVTITGGIANGGLEASAPILPRTAIAPFDNPTGVAVDFAGNIFISEPESNRVRTILTSGDIVDAFELKPETLNSPLGLVINTAGRLVVAGQDGRATRVDYAGPIIDTIDPARASDAGGTPVRIEGRNFAPETQIILAGRLIDARIVDSRTILFTTPQLPSGLTVLTVQNRGGLDQGPFLVLPTPLESLDDGIIATVIGGSTFEGNGGPAIDAQLRSPRGMTIDARGNIYFADWDTHTVRRIDFATGIIQAIAGVGRPGFFGDGGPALAATLDSPRDVAIDSQGNVFIADTGNNRIRRFDASSGEITTVAGSGCDPRVEPCGCGLGQNCCEVANNGSALEAILLSPEGVAVDSEGLLYISDTECQRIRKVEQGRIEIIAGGGTEDEAVLASDISLSFPSGLVAQQGNVYVADWGKSKIRLLRQVEDEWTATTIVTSAEIGLPRGVWLDNLGNLYVADTDNDRIRKVEDGIISTVLGEGVPELRGGAGGPPLTSLNEPWSVIVDGAGNLFAADSGNNRILRLSPPPEPVVTLHSGSSEAPFLGDGLHAGAAVLSQPRHVVVDSRGNLYITDSENHRIRRVDAESRIITTIAGTGTAGFNQEADPSRAQLNSPQGMAFDNAGNLFFADTDNHIVRRIDAARQSISTVAGLAEDPGDDGDGGPPTAARLFRPQAVAFDFVGRLLIADTNNHKIRRIDFNRDQIDTIAGTGEPGMEPEEGVPGRLQFPGGISADPVGNVYVADTRNQRIVMVDSMGNIFTVAGKGIDLGDGPANSVRLVLPETVLWTPEGILLSDTYGHRIRLLQAGTVTTVAGILGDRVLDPSFPLGGGDFCGDLGPALSACLAAPHGIALDADGNKFIADTHNQRIRVVKSAW